MKNVIRSFVSLTSFSLVLGLSLYLSEITTEHSYKFIEFVIVFPMFVVGGVGLCLSFFWIVNTCSNFESGLNEKHKKHKK